MASTTLAATVADATVPMGFMPVRTIPGITTLTPTGPGSLQLGPQDIGEPEHAVFGDGVGPEACQRQDGRHGRDVDDMSLLPVARIRGTNELMPWMTPQRSVSRTRCHSSRPISQEFPPLTIPALFTATWSSPKCSTARRRPARRCQDPGRRTDAATPPSPARRRVRPGPLPVDVRHDDTHALGDERFDNGQPDAAARARHHGRPSLELIHGERIVPGGRRPAQRPGSPPVGEDGGHDGVPWLIRATRAQEG